MILPIVAYGDPVLKKKTTEISEDYPNLDELIANMWETMYNAYGVGLAAPQVGLSIRMFVIDASPFAESEGISEAEQAALKQFKKVFINPKIIDEKGDEWAFNEGCLSIPEINEAAVRQDQLTSA